MGDAGNIFPTDGHVSFNSEGKEFCSAVAKILLRLKDCRAVQNACAALFAGLWILPKFCVVDTIFNVYLNIRIVDFAPCSLRRPKRFLFYRVGCSTYTRLSWTGFL